MKRSLLSLSIALLLGGCSLIPEYQRAPLPVAQAWPESVAGSAGQGNELPAWRSFFRDQALQRLIGVALDHNRDLRAAALNVAAYQAQYRITGSDLLPTVGAGISASRQRQPGSITSSGVSKISSQYNGGLTVSAWELDFFGRLSSLREAALFEFLGSAQSFRAVQTSLVASVATAWLTLEADRELLRLSEDTLRTYEESHKLTERSFAVGVATALDLQQSSSSVESARVSVAQHRRQVLQDQSALQLLLGCELPADLASAVDLDRQQLADLPAGLPSDLLQRRPDVLEAEQTLRAANANIGAARAAFFPSISLTASAGSASSQLSDLFKGGTGAWSFAPQISVPIFTAGSLKASLDYARLKREISVVNYEKAIQTAFSEVSDGLAARSTYQAQLEAQRALVRANQTYYELAERRYRTGVDSHLSFLDAQRQLFASRQVLITTRLAQLNSEISLYKALGGGIE